MFFFLSKTLDVLLEPLVWGLVLAVAGQWLIWRRTWRRLGLKLALLGLLGTTVLSLRPVASALQAWLEADVVSTMREGPYDVVVLLGGAVDHNGNAPGSRAFNGNVERLLAVYDLLRTDRARYAIASGGHVSPELPSEARVLLDQLKDWGIAENRLVPEELAMNTHQNAVEVAKVVRARGWKKVLVVTTAYHVPRALACFRAVGLEVDVLPVDYRMRSHSLELDLLPKAGSLQQSTEVIHEAVGRLVYRVVGYSR